MGQQDCPQENDSGAPAGENNNTKISIHIWPKVRLGLTVCETALVLTQHDALAAGARALVVTGDLIFSRPSTK